MVTPQEFREGMSRFGASVSLVTTAGPAGRHGLTVSAVCPVTDRPPTLLVCINAASRSHDILRANGVLCVNVLAGHHEGLARLFANAGAAGADRFDDRRGRWGHLHTGAPVLADAVAAFDCRIVQVQDVGTHGIFICEVASIAMGEGEGLIYLNRAFHRLPLPVA